MRVQHNGVGSLRAAIGESLQRRLIRRGEKALMLTKDVEIACRIAHKIEDGKRLNLAQLVAILAILDRPA